MEFTFNYSMKRPASPISEEYPGGNSFGSKRFCNSVTPYNTSNIEMSPNMLSGIDSVAMETVTPSVVRNHSHSLVTFTDSAYCNFNTNNNNLSVSPYATVPNSGIEMMDYREDRTKMQTELMHSRKENKSKENSNYYQSSGVEFGNQVTNVRCYCKPEWDNKICLHPYLSDYY